MLKINLTFLFLPEKSQGRAGHIIQQKRSYTSVCGDASSAQPPVNAEGMEISYLHTEFHQQELGSWSISTVGLFKKRFRFVLCVWVFCPVCLCTAGAPGAHGSQKRVLDSMELELHGILTCYVGSGNSSQVLSKWSQCSIITSHLLSSTFQTVNEPTSLSRWQSSRVWERIKWLRLKLPLYWRTV